MTTGNQIVDAVTELRINSIPEVWYKTIRKNNQPHAMAILVLWDLVYWYKASEVRNEATGELIGIKTKFKADLLQRNYSQLSQKFGISKKVASEIIAYLKSLGVVKTELRTIKTFDGLSIPNVMFIAIDPEVLKKLSSYSSCESSEIENGEGDTTLAGGTPITVGEGPISPDGYLSTHRQGGTNTINTTTNSTTTSSSLSASAKRKKKQENPEKEIQKTDDFPEYTSSEKNKKTRVKSEKMLQKEESVKRILSAYMNKFREINEFDFVIPGDDSSFFKMGNFALKNAGSEENALKVIENSAKDNWVKQQGYPFFLIFSQNFVIKYLNFAEPSQQKPNKYESAIDRFGYAGPNGYTVPEKF